MPKANKADSAQDAKRYLVLEDRSISLRNGLVKFNEHDIVTDPFLINVAFEHNVPMIALPE